MNLRKEQAYYKLKYLKKYLNGGFVGFTDYKSVPKITPNTYEYLSTLDDATNELNSLITLQMYYLATLPETTLSLDLRFTPILSDTTLLTINLPTLNTILLSSITLTTTLPTTLTTTQSNTLSSPGSSNLTVGKRIEISDVNPNARDFGGLGSYNIATNKASKIKKGILFRGGLYGGKLENGLKYGITKEITVTGNKKHLPYLSSDNIFGGDWRHLSDKLRGEVLSKCMLWVVEGNKVYIHCDRGCDRTGVFCAILEGILGAPKLDIIDDFKLSDTKGKGYRISHPDLTIEGYLKKYGGNSDDLKTLQTNFMNSVAQKYSIDKNLMLKFINAATDNSIASAKHGGILINSNYKILKEIRDFFYNV